MRLSGRLSKSVEGGEVADVRLIEPTAEEREKMRLRGQERARED